MATTNVTIKDRLGEIDWARLAPGTVVTLPWRADPTGNTTGLAYREKPLLSTPGVTLRGQPGPNGQLPTIDGERATTDAQFACRRWADATQPGGKASIEDGGVITIDQRPGGPRPTGITIEGIHVRGCGIDLPDPSFTAYDGTKRSYPRAAAGVYGVAGDDITVRGCEIEACGNGVLVVGSQACRRWLLEDVYAHDNGCVGSDRQHNTYLEVLEGVTYRRVRYGALRKGALGGHLKDRSCGPQVIDCEFVGLSSRIIDFSLPEDTLALAKLDPQYLAARVANCSIANRTGDAVIMVYAEGRGAGPYVIALDSNTFDVVRNQSETWRVVLCKTEAVDPVAFAMGKNLIRVAPATAGAKPPECSLGTGRGQFKLGPNWSSPGLLKCRSGVQDFGTYDGWEQVVYPPAPQTGFGRQVSPPPVPPAPPPPPPPVVTWVETGRNRVESGDSAAEVVLYRKVVG